MTTPIGPDGTPKKGIPALAWAGIGCGTIAIIVVVVLVLLVGKCKRWANEVSKNPDKAAAEMVVRFSPDLEKVSTNDATGELTYRNKKTGEVVTMSYKDLKAGKFTVKDSEGRVMQAGGQGDLADIPAWVPRYPGATAEGGVFQQKQGAKLEGVANLVTSDAPPAKVVEFYKKEGGQQGLGSSTENSVNLGGQEMSQIEMTGGNRKLTVNAVKAQGEAKTTISLIYSEGGE